MPISASMIAKLSLLPRMGLGPKGIPPLRPEDFQRTSGGFTPAGGAPQSPLPPLTPLQRRLADLPGFTPGQLPRGKEGFGPSGLEGLARGSFKSEGRPIEEFDFPEHIDPKEGISTAAISASGRIYTGRTHAEAVQKAVDAGDAKFSEINNKFLGKNIKGDTTLIVDDLFITETGKLVDRITASEGRTLFASSEFLERGEKTFKPKKEVFKGDVRP